MKKIKSILDDPEWAKLYSQEEKETPPSWFGIGFFIIIIVLFSLLIAEII